MWSDETMLVDNVERCRPTLSCDVKHCHDERRVDDQEDEFVESSESDDDHNLDDDDLGFQPQGELSDEDNDSLTPGDSAAEMEIESEFEYVAKHH